MKNLDYKFRKNKISLDELNELRSKVNSMSDHELEELMVDSWNNEEMNISFVEDEAMSRLKKNVEKLTGRKEKYKSLLSLVTKIAAVILLPLFIAISFYLYKENNQLVSEELIVSTGKSERAKLTLPDQTYVTLNSDSKLSYIPRLYNKEERIIDFEGEGYFQVYEDAGRPFIINTASLQVKVLGTTFNLNVRKSRNIAELSLEEGSVSLISIHTQKTVILKPDQKAILNQTTGEFTIIPNNNRNTSAWQRGDIIFRNTSLFDVVKTIEENYNVNIKIACEDCLGETFTGTVPITNLNEVLEIIEQSYHLKATIKEKDIILE